MGRESRRVLTTKQFPWWAWLDSPAGRGCAWGAVPRMGPPGFVPKPRDRDQRIMRTLRPASARSAQVPETACKPQNAEQVRPACRFCKRWHSLAGVCAEQLENNRSRRAKGYDVVSLIETGTRTPVRS